MQALPSLLTLALLSTAAAAQCDQLHPVLHAGSPQSAPLVHHGGTAKGTVLFSDGGQAGREAYWYDGQQVVGPLEILPGPGSGALLSSGLNRITYAVLGGQAVAVFTGTDGQLASSFPHTNYEPWMCDGTTVMPLPEALPGKETMSPDHYTYSAGKVFFVGRNNATGNELWVTDGSATWQVAELCPGLCDGVTYSSLRPYRDGILFTGIDPAHGAELWFSDGTAAGTYLVADLEPGPAGSLASPLMRLGDEYVVVANTSAHGVESWLTDGTSLKPMAEVIPGPRSGTPSWLGVGFGKAFFSADDDVHGQELWAYDLATGTSALFADLAPGPASSKPAQIMVHADGLLILDDANHGRLHWAPWDGQQLGAATLLHSGQAIPWLGHHDHLIAPMGRGVYFVAPYGSTGRELWYVEPGVTAPALVCDLWPGLGNSYPQAGQIVDDKLAFLAADPYRGWALRALETGQATSMRIEPGAPVTTLTATPPALSFKARIEHYGALPGATTVVLLGAPQDEPQVLATGDLVWTDPFTAQVVATGTGPVVDAELAVPAAPALAGVRRHVQAFSVPGHGAPFDVSNAVRLVLGN